MAELDESGCVDITAPKRVRDVVAPVHHEHDSERAAAGMVASMAGEVRLDCPRCGEDVFVRLAAELGSSWHCESCGAYGPVGEA